MPATPHTEHHFTAPESVRDVVIGMSDGLTVPFALAAGISGAIAINPHASTLVVTAGLAEIAAGSIAMGLGGYLAARTDIEHYASEREREVREIVELRDVEIEEVAKVFRDYGLTETEMAPVVKAITGNEKAWVDFMMRFELGLEEPQPKRARISALTIAVSYIVGGLIPLAPYILLSDVQTGPVLFRGSDAAGAGGVWLGERDIYWDQPVQRWNANRCYGRPRGRRCVSHSKADQPVGNVARASACGF